LAVTDVTGPDFRGFSKIADRQDIAQSGNKNGEICIGVVAIRAAKDSDAVTLS